MKKIPTSYTFDRIAKTITCDDFIFIEKIALIVNLTAGEIIYQFNSSAKGGTLAGNVLTLDFDTSAMTNSDKLQILIHDEQPKTAGGASLVGNAKTKWRFDGANLDGFDIIQVGSGQSHSLEGTTGGIRYLKIVSGVTANAETIFQSKEIFGPPLSFAFGLTMSQRIINTEVHVELVEVDDDGNVMIDNSSFSAPNFKDARSGCGLKYDGTSANNASIKVRTKGISELVKTSASHGTGFTTATGTNPNFNPTLQGEISFNTDRVVTAGRSIDSNALRTEGGRSTTIVPDPDGKYKIRIRVKNLGTAPVSSTDIRLHFAKIIDHTRLSVDFGAIAGSLNGSDAIPVYNVNLTSTSVTASVTPPAPTTPYWRNSTADTNGALIITGTSGLQSFYATNEGASPAFVKLYNKATAPVVGTDIPEMIIPVPAAVGGVPGVATFPIGFIAFRFALGLGIAITANAIHTDTTAVAAGQVKVKLSRTT